MPTYTHVFSNNLKKSVPLDGAKEALATPGFGIAGISLLDMSRVRFDKHGLPCRSAGGWSYGHVQHGWLCAGAGGVNSLPVMDLRA
jgi:hypothetical protein